MKGTSFLLCIDRSSCEVNYVAGHEVVYLDAS